LFKQFSPLNKLFATNQKFLKFEIFLNKKEKQNLEKRVTWAGPPGEAPSACDIDQDDTGQ
jgi:hypothetical protein